MVGDLHPELLLLLLLLLLPLRVLCVLGTGLVGLAGLAAVAVAVAVAAGSEAVITFTRRPFLSYVYCEAPAGNIEGKSGCFDICFVFIIRIF